MSGLSNLRMCQYSGLLGEVGQGLHSFRVMNIAIVDVILTFVGAKVISKVFDMDYFETLFKLVLLGIFLHWLFCVPTTVNRTLGLA